MYQWNLNDLNPAQRAVVENGDGPVLVLAGAGSGKTRALTYRIAYLLQVRRIPPYRILAMTFTNKAAREMTDRICRMLETDAPRIWIGTIHANCAKILRRESRKLGWRDPFVIYNEDDQRRLLKDLMEALNYSTTKYNPRSILSTISRAKSYLKTSDDIEGDSPYYQMIRKLYEEYDKALANNHAFDFDDLILKVITLFEANPDILRKYQRQFRYTLVDEFQDTNVAQYRFLQLLTGDNKNLLVVGDDDQSIYRWRGAEVENILQFDKDFPDTKIYFLEQNYRSTKNILAAAQSVVRNNVLRREKSLWSDRPEGEKVLLMSLETSKQEADWIASRIRDELFAANRKLSDYCILYRTNAQSRLLEEKLRDSNLPYIVIGGIRFYERKEVKDVLAYLQVIVNPADEISLKRIINFPARGIGKITLQRFDKYAKKRGISWYQAFKEIDRIDDINLKTRQRLSAFAELIKKYIRLRKVLAPGELIRSLVDELGLANLYKSEGSKESLDRWANVMELLSAVSEFKRIGEEDTLEEFLNHVSLVTSIDLIEGKKEAVTLMTVHNAKGLEFPTAFITGLEDGLFPVSGSFDTLESLEEERRLFYVGATRAKDFLYLSWARQRQRYGKMEYNMASRFLDELDESCICRAEYEMFSQYNIPSKIKIRRKKTDGNEREMLYAVGQNVLHPNFGYGVIKKVDGKFDNTKLTVFFQDVGEKRLFAKFARLENV